MEAASILEDIARIIKDCSVPDWDGYGAEALTEAVVEPCKRFLAALPDSCARPWAGPENDGCIAFEWENGSNWLLSASVKLNGEISWAGIVGGERLSGTFPMADGLPEKFVSAVMKFKEEQP